MEPPGRQLPYRSRLFENYAKLSNQTTTHGLWLTNEAKIPALLTALKRESTYFVRRRQETNQRASRRTPNKREHWRLFTLPSLLKGKSPKLDRF